ncbi:hypothetical protein OROGR_002685 [Orobanche gracilis]
MAVSDLEVHVKDMSSASRSKSKDKKVVKEPPKSSSKPALQVNTTSGAPESGYNPLSRTFHTFETSPVPSASPLHGNIRFRNVDDTDDHNNSNASGNGIEYDSVSNNSSWSGESEDHKVKTPPQPQLSVVPGSDNDKREKIRLQNEKKHQRQKERRSQELHERCSGYLMSRKLELLSQQLVAMGFSRERATMALILNEGRVEESVAWLFENDEEEEDNKQMKCCNPNSGGNLKIEILEELARIKEVEIKYKASKQEVERVVVTCEGDLDKAEEILKAQKGVQPSKPEEIGDPPSVANSKQQTVPINENPLRIQPKYMSSSTTQWKRDEKDFNYTKLPAMVGSPVEPGAKSVQVLRKAPPKSDWTKPQQIANSSTSFSMVSLAPPPPAKTEPPKYVAIGNEIRNLQLGSGKEPVIVMQRHQSITTLKQAPPSTSLSSSPPRSMGWYVNSAETVKPNEPVPSFSVSRSLISPNGVGSNPMHNQFHYQSQQQYASSRGGLQNRGGPPALAAASSLGLFSGVGTNGSSGPLDWKMGSSKLQCDYANVDWSLDRRLLPLRPDGLWAGVANCSMQNNAGGHDSFGYDVKSSGMMPVVLSNRNGAMVQGLNNGVGSIQSGSDGSREWSSPFEEMDIFVLPRQYVPSPSL